MSKLTLHVPEELVAAAKSEAAARHVSVSKLVTDFFRNLATKNSATPPSDLEQPAPHTGRLIGCIPNAELKDYVDYLENKHS